MKCKCGCEMKIGSELIGGLGQRTAYYCPIGEDKRWWLMGFLLSLFHTNPVTVSIP